MYLRANREELQQRKMLGTVSWKTTEGGIGARRGWGGVLMVWGRKPVLLKRNSSLNADSALNYKSLRKNTPVQRCLKFRHLKTECFQIKIKKKQNKKKKKKKKTTKKQQNKQTEIVLNIFITNELKLS